MVGPRIVRAGVARVVASRRVVIAGWVLVLTAATSALAADGQSPVRMVAHDGREAVTLGVLVQPTLQVDRAASETTVADACFRRIRLVGNAQAGRLSVFADTDTPYLGYHATSWATPATFLQDLIVTYRVDERLQIDTGLLLVPVSYNSTQSAASLFAIGYSPYSFLASAPTHSRTGRDEGVQARGLLARRRLEYRVGVFRGIRKVTADAPARVTARAAWALAGTLSPNFFYAGTQQGRQKRVSVGASLDTQDRYRALAADLFTEWPVTANQHLTLQTDVIHYDGGATFRQLPRQVAWMVEAGYLFDRQRVQPFIQVAQQAVRMSTVPDAASYQAGLIYWRRAHAMNVKMAVGRTHRDGGPAHTQLTVQSQWFVF